jgi:hypothetical protein
VPSRTSEPKPQVPTIAMPVPNMMLPMTIAMRGNAVGT